MSCKDSEERKNALKTYCQSPEYRARKKEYRQRPEVKAKKKLRMAAYRQRPGVKAREKKRGQRSEIKVNLEGYRLKRSYGLTLSEKAAMLEKQGGKCAICKTNKFNGRGPVVDHDHVTGRVRGILCVNCNMTLGRIKESISILKNAIDYLTPSRG